MLPSDVSDNDALNLDLDSDVDWIPNAGEFWAPMLIIARQNLS